VVAAMQRRVLLAAIAWLCLVCTGWAQPLSFPSLTGRVIDEAGLFTAPDRAALSDTLAVLEAKTTDQLVVVTLKSLQGLEIEDYGYQLGRHWKIGQKDKNNGVLLIVAPGERRVRIEVGYGLEGTLTDALTKVIIENSILPRFKAGDLAGGVKAGVNDIVRVLTGDAADLQSRDSASGTLRSGDAAPVGPAIILALGVIGLLMFCAVTRGGVVCRRILQFMLLMLLSGSGRSSRGKSWSGGGGSFGGGGSSGRW